MIAYPVVSQTKTIDLYMAYMVGMIAKQSKDAIIFNQIYIIFLNKIFCIKFKVLTIVSYKVDIITTFKILY